ncbi:hypothetical protein [Thalassoroseus pseudoceratinae]|uniref:hypothetical protein n=1 Tax=Thalassoroseus pseudoceratinae TaxID=2713176 RepID=UPI00141DD6D4|nr:hypothetical protein [Thalassoroseus pseudoceratinae]
MASFWTTLHSQWTNRPQQRSKRRGLARTIETCEERLVLSGAPLTTVVDSPLAPPAINGFEQSAFGDFDGDGQDDDIFAWNSVSGANRFVIRSGNNFVFTTNAIAPGAINGRDFVHVVAGSYDGNGTTDLFFWNPASGRNRLAHINTTANLVNANVETEVVPTGAINGNDFQNITSGEFNDGGSEEIFFWNQVTGRNRFAVFNVVTTGQDTDLGRIETNFLDPRGINGNDFRLVRAGNFSPDGPDSFFDNDELVFVNLTTGDVRVFEVETVPGPSGPIVKKTPTDDAVNPAAFNGDLFQHVVVGDYNDDGFEDIFLWNQFTGQNRIGFADPNADTPSLNIDSDCVPRGAVNGNAYSSVVTIEETGGDSLFFVSLNTGLNRLLSS